MHEEALVRAFIVPAKQERLIELLAKPRRRSDVLRTLAHFRDLDPRFARAVRGADGSLSGILAWLRKRGAPRECHVISEAAELDGKTMPLEDALRAIVGRGMGSLVSCIPGRLGIFEGEEKGDRWILERESGTTTG